MPTLSHESLYGLSVSGRSPTAVPEAANTIRNPWSEGFLGVGRSLRQGEAIEDIGDGPRVTEFGALLW